MARFLVGRVDTPVRLDWTSGTRKILGIFLGTVNVEEMNWRPRIVAVKNDFNSWCQRGLSFRGKALINNALALARICYVASLIHLPAWALRELASLVFSFFWKGKPDSVAREVVCQPTSLGRFGVVSIELKACALLVQWIRRLVTKPASWVHFFAIIVGVAWVVRLWMFFPALLLLICRCCLLSITLYLLPSRR